jgi:hypothetical protein
LAVLATRACRLNESTLSSFSAIAAKLETQPKDIEELALMEVYLEGRE